MSDMDQPLPSAVRQRRQPTQRELDLEAEGFMALYAQVQSK